jgi:alpha-methylacyl-CoA racemase
MAGIGPGPFCGMMLADLGAEVIRVDRPMASNSIISDPRLDLMGRGKRSITLDLKKPAEAEVLWKLIEGADGLLEGFRPGVMERNGFGPDAVLARRPTLVYGRMTGFGQTGPLAKMAGHDINYLSLSGALGAIGPKERPVIPLNLVADFGGGAMFLAVGMLSALLHVKAGGKGQVVDAAMVDGTSLLTVMFHSLRAMGQWRDERETNFLDGAAHFYNVYETKDGKWVSIGPIEPQFYAELVKRMELSGMQAQLDPARWPELKAVLARRFKEKTRAEWDAVFEGSDACYTPVLTLADAAQHPHNVARGTFVERFGVQQPAPAPRFSGTSPVLSRPPPTPGEHNDEILRELGIRTAV